MEPTSSSYTTPSIEQPVPINRTFINQQILNTLIKILNNIHTCLCEAMAQQLNVSISPITGKYEALSQHN